MDEIKNLTSPNKKEKGVDLPFEKEE